MTTLLFTHPVCLEHDTGAGHPECPDRLRAVLAALDADVFKSLEHHEAPLCETAALERVHAPNYVRDVFESVPQTGRFNIDTDTLMSPKSGEAALRAAGGAVAAVDAVMNGADNAFAAVRPPGHHAERDRAMGFCLFNNVAVAAEHARAAHGLTRVAVIDFDVHHGNGTQHMFEHDAGLFYGSSHQWPCYPGTGMAHESGVAGNIANLQLAPGAGGAEFRAGFPDAVLKPLRMFAPELLIISAGFDAHARDPLAQINLETDDYRWVTEELMTVAHETDACGGRVISCLEGGYDLQALGEGTAAHVSAMMGVSSD
ncbi:MAG: histone deacetylase family protein [Rhodospirillales bacterium]